jgi:hypothetical protein
MTYDPRLYALGIDFLHDEAWSALPNAPVVEPGPPPLRRRAAARLHRLAERIEGVELVQRRTAAS